MSVRKAMFGLLLVALVVSACGRVTPTEQAAIETSDAGISVEEDGSQMAMSKDASESTMKEDLSLPMTEKDGSGSEIETDEPQSTMEEDTSGAMTEKDGSESVMETDGSPSTMERGDTASTPKASDSEEMMTEEEGGTMMEEDAPNAASVMEGEAMKDFPTWFGAELTDVNTGEVFTMADLQGKVVLVETMAMWCSNCLRQQQEVKALHEVLGEQKDLFTVVLDVDPNENAENLRDYAAKHGFTWTYVVAPREVAPEIGQLYGVQFLNPPATPMLIVDRHGEVHLLPFGRKSSEDLQQALSSFLGERR